MRFHPILTCFAVLTAACGSGDSNFTNTEEDPKPVDGESVMEVSATELNWSDMEVGQTYSKEFTISSVGEVDLQLYEARILVGGDVFYLPALQQPSDSRYRPHLKWQRDWRRESCLRTAGIMLASLLAAARGGLVLFLQSQGT